MDITAINESEFERIEHRFNFVYLFFELFKIDSYLFIIKIIRLSLTHLLLKIFKFGTNLIVNILFVNI